MFNIFTNKTEEFIFKFLYGFVNKYKYNIVRIRIRKQHKIYLCQIMIEKKNNKLININDCSKMNNNIISLNKGLKGICIEISSTGLNKPLTRNTDLIISIGSIIKIYTLYKIGNQKKFKGQLHKVYKTSIKIFILNSLKYKEISLHSISEIFLQY